MGTNQQTPLPACSPGCAEPTSNWETFSSAMSARVEPVTMPLEPCWLRLRPASSPSRLSEYLVECIQRVCLLGIQLAARQRLLHKRVSLRSSGRKPPLSFEQRRMRIHRPRPCGTLPSRSDQCVRSCCGLAWHAPDHQGCAPARQSIQVAEQPDTGLGQQQRRSRQLLRKPPQLHDFQAHLR